MKLVKGFVASENDASITWPANDAAIYAIVNKDSPNKFGEYPGYRLKRCEYYFFSWLSYCQLSKMLPVLFSY